MEESEMKNNEKANKRLDHCGFASRLLLGAAAVCVFTLISVATASADNSSHRPIAFTESGLVIGSTTDGGNEFLGIPYAAPPVGALRWRPPKRYGFFPGFVLQATQFGSACTQPGGIGGENCLFLNVTRRKRNRVIEEATAYL
jgi:para-nitrobenzyl esterase